MRSAIKRLSNLLSLLLVSPIAVPVLLSARWDSGDKVFQFGSHVMSIFPGIPGEYLRRAFYWVTLGGEWPGPTVLFGTIFAQRDTHIGREVYIGAFCNIGSCTIENDVLIGSNVIIASPKMHLFDRLDVPIRHQGGEIVDISIGQGAWLGNGCVVLNNVGDGAVVAAGAVIVNDCESNGIYGGNPARLIRMRGAKT